MVTSSGPRPVEHAGIYLGSPDEQAALVPDAQRKSRTEEIITWQIKRAESDDFWLGCSYTGTTAMLFRKLDSAVRGCTASYDLLPTGKRQRLRNIACQ